MAPKAKGARSVKKTAAVKRKPARSGAAPSGIAKRKSRAKRKASGLELKIYAMLDALGIDYVKEKAISACKVDLFIEPLTVVELQGCYWHKHDCLEPSSGWTQSDLDVKLADFNRIAFLKSAGFKVVEIWECEVSANPHAISKLLQKLATGKSDLSKERRAAR